MLWALILTAAAPFNIKKIKPSQERAPIAARRSLGEPYAGRAIMRLVKDSTELDMCSKHGEVGGSTFVLVNKYTHIFFSRWKTFKDVSCLPPMQQEHFLWHENFPIIENAFATQLSILHFPPYSSIIVENYCKNSFYSYDKPQWNLWYVLSKDSFWEQWPEEWGLMWTFFMCSTFCKQK